MKKILVLLIVFGLALGACSKKEESPNPVTKQTTDDNTGGTGGGGGTSTPTQPALTTADNVQFWGLIDGSLVTYKAGGGSTQAGNDKDSIMGTDSTAKYYLGGVINTLDLSGFTAVRGVLLYPNGYTPTEAEFLSLFTKGSKTLAPFTTEIVYNTGLIDTWSTSSGNQNGSTFEITEVQSTGTPSAPSVKVVMKFECKIYNDADPTKSKQITKGIMVAEFAAN